MSRSWRDEVRLGLCPDRLVVARRSHRWSARVSREIRPVEADPIAALKHEVAGTRATVVLSSHFVRYLVLPWSQALTCEEDWIAFAHHTFQSTYGAASTTGWQIRLSNTGPGRARVASAVDCALIDALRSLPEVVSIQPYLMSAFNARRRAIGGKAAWFVLQEATRLTVALIAEGEWQLVRTRQANGDWHAALPALLDRESALSGSSPCERLVVCSEEEPPPRAERYEIVDLTLPRGANASLRQYAMTSH